jgi:hypothetical protein
MKLREPGNKSILVVLAALLLLLPLLAVLQYRWQAQLSEREQEHMKLNLRAIAQRFEQDFDDEIARAYAVLSLPSDQIGDENLVEYSKRYDRWLSIAQHPKLLKDLFVARPDKDGSLVVSQLNVDQRRFARTEWPSNLETLKPQLQRLIAGEPRPSMRDLITNRIKPLDGGEIALINPSFAQPSVPPRTMPPSPSLAGFVVVVLNHLEIEQEMLPALAKRHFAGTQALDYGATVVGPAPEHKLVYHFGADVPGNAEADVTVGLFGFGRDSFRRVFSSLPPGEPGLSAYLALSHLDQIDRLLRTLLDRGGSNHQDPVRETKSPGSGNCG